ncbi:adhesion G protein-coupled receptor F5-like isoform X6 [Siniperca chuatsi]|uniref:adhesion G protein-coupled receptor F5-like isoform X6 n=1 Tax=Siniperca chuatsi TaxID=119488 RepID=UPI001CE0D5AA|nr:adhesion G protein-coupled receptor F5-like isoform X6 [Siniperca chuatsi]
MSTVCSLSSGGYQCRCEDQYRWSCDQCFLYGSCDNITDDTCGCINAIPPDGQYCQSVDQHNFTACPFTTTAPSPTTSPVLYEYLISIDLNISDVAVINHLRTILSNISYPISINNHIHISDVNMSTVCSLSSGGYQCRCEDQYRWSCDQCFLYGSCDNITDDTCGCINAIPPDGQYCQSVDQHNFTACPVTTPSPSPTNSTSIYTTKLNTTTATTSPTTVVTNSTHPNTTTPTISPTTVVTNSTPVATTDVNTTTAATPTTIITNSTTVATTDVKTTVTTTPTTAVTNSTHPNTTTPTISPTTVVTNSTPVATTDVNTTTAATPTTIITNSTTVATTDVKTTVTTTPPTTVTNSTHPNTTTPTISPTTVVTNSTPVATTDVNTTTAATPTTIITNSTTVATTDVKTTVTTTPPTTVTNSTHPNTTTPTISPTTVVTNSTPVATTDVNTTTAATPTTIITNSTTVATTDVKTTVTTTPPTTVTNSTHPNTTTPTISPTTVVTNSTPVATTDVNTTTAATPTTIITNSTTVATTDVKTTVTTTPPTTVTNSTPVATTDVNTTTAATPIITNSTTVTTTPTTTVTNSTHPNTTTPTISPTTVVTNSTTVTTTPPTTVTNSIHPNTTTPTISPTTVVTNSTPVSTTGVSTTTAATPTAIITNSTTVTTTPTTTVTSFDVEMSVRLDKEYTAELNNSASSTYKELESRINSVLKEQYKGITGFINVFVRGFREGSIITNFVVQTTQVNPDEVAKANQKLPEAMQSIAPVIGSVTAFYNSPTSISFPNLTYTGSPMTLTCGPPPENINVGQISGFEWKFKERGIKDSERMKITASNMKSMLTVSNVILPDIGRYKCTLRGEVINFFQEGVVTGNEIKQAPIVRLQSKVNVKCKEGQIQPLQCCVQSTYRVRWFRDETVLPIGFTDNGETYCIKHDYQLESCSGSQPKEIYFICKVDEPKGYEMTTLMTIFKDGVKCDNAPYGTGRAGDISSIGCDNGQEGSRTAVCQETGEWKLMEDTCIITQIKELLIDSQDLVVQEVPEFVANLSKTVQEDQTEIANSSATISAIVNILNTIAIVSTVVSESVMQNILETVDVIIGDDAKESWAALNANETRNASSELLGSLETLSNGLVGKFVIATQRILLSRTQFNNSFRADLNSSIVIDIPNTNINNVFITTITFSTLNNVMPARNSSFDASLFNATSNETVNDNAINAAVVLVQINATIQNVTLSYDKLNNSLSLNPQCVFWNFTLFDNLGAWDDEGCEFVSDRNNTVTCSCNHLTSFSLLMATDIPPELKDALDIITYIGVGISLASLVICLIIEGYVWKAITRNSTAFMRHVSIINTALSLLIADICFIIGASIAKNPLENPGEDYEVPVRPCSTATFFMHFFYLALFFWMLVSGLLLFYRTVMVFSHMSKSTMLAIGFSLGYGCPLIIAVITVAVTAPGNGYIRKYDACWLNWIETKALLALVIPALTIVFINILIVIVVLFKMLRRGVGDTAQTDEKHTLVVITRCVVILTPLFGLTWSLGVGTISSTNKGIHIAFAFFNSLQGFFILVFGTLFDSKIRSILSRKLPTSSTGSNPTRSTSGGISSLSGLNWISRLRGRRYIYRVSEAANSSSAGASESFVNI